MSTLNIEMSTLNQSVTVWQLYIMFLRVMGPTSSSRNLPVQKYILSSPKKTKAFEEKKKNCEKAEQDKSAVAKHTWTYDHRIKWDEATILAIDSHKFSRKMRESIEIEKHNTIDQEGKPLDSTWRALFNVQN